MIKWILSLIKNYKNAGFSVPIVKIQYGGIKMANRQRFTEMLAQLITEMINAGDEPILDYLLRSKEEQKRLFDAGMSKCDGIIKKSAHQFGKAIDIYLTKNDIIQFEWDKDKAVKWHKRWEEIGGKPMISWDSGHFEL